MRVTKRGILFGTKFSPLTINQPKNMDIRVAPVDKSKSSTVPPQAHPPTFCSTKNRLTEFFQEQIQLDREAKKESLDRELAARLAVVELQKRNEDLKILTFDATGMNPEDATRIEALKEKVRATYFNF
ncbi:hypothetical protein Tco_0200581 [Tanacetum coccineum]